MVYLIIGLVLAVGLAGYLAWRLVRAIRALEEARDRLHELQKDRAIRQNLQHILDGREAELRKLRSKLRSSEANVQTLENRVSELNLTLFEESGMRILSEKEDGAKRMKMDLMERQLDEANRANRELKEKARAREAELTKQIEALEAEIDRLKNPRGRRAVRRPVKVDGWDQITLDDLIGGDPNTGK